MDPNARTRLSEARPDPLIGRTFDGYRVDEVIGRGGMGTVYKANQLSLGRPVAIKVLSADLVEKKQFLERFHREADVLSRLSHPNVVAVYDRGEIDGQPYLAMEFVEGTSLREIVREGPLSSAEALRIVSSVLAALECAHDAGIVHRDIKPENVLLARNRVVKVADFGLSRLLGSIDETRLTRTQLVLGTYEYMAPEQRERAREADSRSDLYATGVVLYEMLTGELPIGRFDLPSRSRPDECDARIDGLIEKSLNKNPDQRFQRASEMGSAVSAILERPGAVEPAPRPVGPATPASYKPMRFEHHIDNVATINHVLGTVAYVFGFLSLFGAARFVWISVPFFLFFIGGWYLRNTAEGLRKYRPHARTAQAVIAIVGGFTFILLPFSIYSTWVLFSHRGRTYYDARGRGLTEQAAARHTYRMLEEPYPVPPAPPPKPTGPGKAGKPPPPPRPSQIPVQSMVTSEVTLPPPMKRTWSPFVPLGYFALFATVIIGGLTATDVIQTDDYLPAPVAVTIGCFGLGFLHALFSYKRKGAIAALIGLVVLGALVPVYDEVRREGRGFWGSLKPTRRPAAERVLTPPRAATEVRVERIPDASVFGDVVKRVKYVLVDGECAE